MEIELQKINNIVIISNDTVIGNESAGMKKVSPRRQNLLSNSEIVCGQNFGIGGNLDGPSRFFFRFETFPLACFMMNPSSLFIWSLLINN